MSGFLFCILQTNRPLAQVYLGTVPPRGPAKPDDLPYYERVVVFNDWLKTKVPALGPHFHLVGICGLFVGADGQVKDEHSADGIFLKDGIHSSHNG